MFQYLFALVIVLFVYLLIHQKNDPRTPPGVYGWPIFGAVPSFKVPFPNQLEEYRKKFGDVFLWRTGSKNNVYLCDPKIIRKAFSHPNLIDRPHNHFTFDSWSYFTKMGIINGEGKSWEEHRRFCLRHLRDSGLGKSTAESIIELEVESLIKTFKAHFGDSAAEIPVAVNAATLNVIWKLSSGFRFEEDDKDLKILMDSITLATTLIQGAINLLDIYPWLVPLAPKFVMDKIGFTRLQEVRQVAKDYVQRVVDQRKAVLNNENPCGLIDSYLFKIEQEQNNEEKIFSEPGLVLVLGDLIFAGSDTTATTIKWGLQILAYYPEIQTKIQCEIDSIIPRERLPTIDDKQRLPLTEATIHEILRITTLTPVGLFHAAREDTMIEQYFIPKGTIVSAFILRCHTHPDYWQKPNEFYPENFLDADGNFTGKNEAFMPFSTGRRSCLGESLARTELFLFMAGLLQKFTFRLAEGETSCIVRNPECVVFNLPPKLKLVVRER